MKKSSSFKFKLPKFNFPKFGGKKGKLDIAGPEAELKADTDLPDANISGKLGASHFICASRNQTIPTTYDLPSKILYM